jgi:hypothetical protein
MIRKHHPSFYHLIHETIKGQGNMEHLIIDVETGRQVKEPQRLKYCMATQRFQGVALSLKNIRKATRQLSLSWHVDLPLPCNPSYKVNKKLFTKLWDMVTRNETAK